MRTLSYVSGATGESIGFEGPLYGGTLTGLRARIWDYSLASPRHHGHHTQDTVRRPSP